MAFPFSKFTMLKPQPTKEYCIQTENKIQILQQEIQEAIETGNESKFQELVTQAARMIEKSSGIPADIILQEALIHSYKK